MRFIRYNIIGLAVSLVFYAFKVVFTTILSWMHVGSADIWGYILAGIGVFIAAIYYINWNMKR